jgi:ribonuclease HI
MAVTVVADYKLELTQSRLFGVCYIEFSPPLNQFDFHMGFALRNATHLRCALQAIITAVEAIHGCAFMQVPCVILATKNEEAYRLLTDPNCVTKWIKSNWPKSQSANRTLLQKAYNQLASLNKDVVTFVYIERELDDKAYVDLDQGRTVNGIDMDKVDKTRGQKYIEDEINKIRQNGVMAKKLIGSGAKCYRPTKKKVV